MFSKLFEATYVYAIIIFGEIICLNGQYFREKPTHFANCCVLIVEKRGEKSLSLFFFTWLCPSVEIALMFVVDLLFRLMILIIWLFRQETICLPLQLLIYAKLWISYMVSMVLKFIC